MTHELEKLQRKGTKPMVILDRKRSDDLLRECGYETKAATPAVGGEVREQIAKIVCCPGGCILATCGDDACVALNPEHTMLPTADAILAALPAASPASPLRGRENMLVRALVDVLAYEQEAAKLSGFSDCTCMGRSRAAESAYEMGECPHQKARAALSALPLEQPAKETSK